MTRLARRVLQRWILADQAKGQRKRVRDLTYPLNPPKGFDRELRKEQGETVSEGENVTIPDHKDLKVRDVFPSNRNNQGVQNLVETGEGFRQEQVTRDKGFDVVKNLSQYLIRTEGGSEGGPEGRNL